ncbi:MAG: hypothetical protein F6K25_32395 [Okeania sp. SIO2G4]|uniref:hypothetical protein n=1 Tax=unclassified Okeania TaxID=2634635 RepID=UPI0013B7BAE8|nr:MULTISPECIES: hypothetical protein [unclassified Okeania]NEP06715.1 hypothetical protein [Okeania sp. SIO4D6]NEP74406.1 hypothetical protein [Okeania sp. SIO2G5]NEP95519.1 hypothetical protein [Okeania sp. SIO2F5]NEQ95060.1 hypothetical protein [Okeania sp. SIO2G4]
MITYYHDFFGDARGKSLPFFWCFTECRLIIPVSVAQSLSGNNDFFEDAKGKSLWFFRASQDDNFLWFVNIAIAEQVR